MMAKLSTKGDDGILTMTFQASAAMMIFVLHANGDGLPGPRTKSTSFTLTSSFSPELLPGDNKLSVARRGMDSTSRAAVIVAGWLDGFGRFDPKCEL
jgi:hypothetical protein